MEPNDSQKVSIVVPVYNAEKYIDSCIQSIVDQSYQNWELLLIDDGSSDNSGLICDRWKALDARIRVFHGANHGVSAARNTGIKKAEGEWLMFVDSDDCISIDCLQTCIHSIRSNFGIDMVQFGYRIVTLENEETIKSHETKPLQPKEYLKTCPINVTVWASLINIELIRNNNISFKEGIKYSEDKMFIFECIGASKLIIMIADVLYDYILRKSSAIHNSKSADLVESCNALISFQERNPMFKLYTASTIHMHCITLLKRDDVSVSTIIDIYKRGKASPGNLNSKMSKLVNLMVKFESVSALSFLRFIYRIKSKL